VGSERNWRQRSDSWLFVSLQHCVGYEDAVKIIKEVEDGIPHDISTYSKALQLALHGYYPVSKEQWSQANLPKAEYRAGALRRIIKIMEGKPSYYSAYQSRCNSSKSC
jgi:alpha-amylase/alpha-mannosidase (GH57 family)